MTDAIALDDRIGTREAEVLRNLSTWLDVSEGLTDAQAELVRHVVANPEVHRRDVNAVIEEEFTYAELVETFERTQPRTWGYPADSWGTVRRVAQLRTETVLTAEQAVVRALSERGHSGEAIAERVGLTPAAVDGVRHRIDRQIDAARRTLDLLEE